MPEIDLSGSSLTPQTKQLVSQWAQWERQGSKTLAEIESLVKSNDEAELKKRLSERITFGTAGLRGPMQAGTNAMNDVTVTQATQGLALYLEDQFPDIKTRGVCVGYDGRHNSKRFSDLTAATFISRGIRVYRVSRLCATPLLAYCVTLKKAAAGVMITASHNPKQDNGYKVYWDNGSQIISPHDAGITKRIIENLAPWDIDIDKLVQSELLVDPTEELAQAYFSQIKSLCYHSEENKKAKTPIVFTAMHGVGKEWVTRAFEAFQLPPFIPVPEQIEADPDFPTVAFPNPEEGKGALKLSIETAEKHASSFIIANDPDSDRLALAEKQKDSSWKIFNGNEIGILLAHWSWTQAKAKDPSLDPSKCFFVNTTVSSKMLASMAQKEGLQYFETLTGFKWIGNKVEEIEKKGNKFIFGFEEAIGFMVGNVCLDKDGVRTAGVAAEMKLFYEAQGITLNEHLEQLYQLYGAHVTNNRYFFCYDPKKMESIFDTIRNGGKYTDQIGNFKITGIRDLTTGYDSTQPDKKAILPTSKSSHMITFWFENGGVLTLRGSGTEPKLKYYSELKGKDFKDTQRELQELVAQAIDSFLKPKENNLEPPRD